METKERVSNIIYQEMRNLTRYSTILRKYQLDIDGLSNSLNNIKSPRWDKDGFSQSFVMPSDLKLFGIYDQIDRLKGDRDRLSSYCDFLVDIMIHTEYKVSEFLINTCIEGTSATKASKMLGEFRVERMVRKSLKAIEHSLTDLSMESFFSLFEAAFPVNSDTDNQ